tara:strand:+ start:1364 stop:1822 length:459 start_codon:yes stop_codon:yes gene_type:complete
MAHYAKVVDGVVETVIVADQEWVDGLEGTYVRTSYNTSGGSHIDGGTPLRKNYAGVGFVYDETRDAFYESQPYASWTLNEDTCFWESPKPHPDDGKAYSWDEETVSWSAPPSPYPSWTLDDTTNLWEAPEAYPDDNKIYNWDEDTTSWFEVE